MILAVCFAVLSWSLCFAIFNNPEVPRNYEILRKLDRLPIHTNYSEESQPSLDTIAAPELRNKFLGIDESEVDVINLSLKKSFLTNYKDRLFSLYLKGQYKVTATRELTKDDFITEGFAVQLRAFIQPDEYTKASAYPVVAEVIFPTKYRAFHKNYHAGDILEISKTSYFASILHASSIVRDDDDTIIVITAVSLANKLRPPHAGPYDLIAPLEVNLNAKFPLFEVAE